jgi:hypothetical protein
MSGNIQETKTLDYFKAENIYKRNKRIESQTVFTDTELVNEFSHFELGTIPKTKNNTITLPRLTRPGATRHITRTETKLMGMQKIKIDVAPKIKQGILTKQVEKQILRSDQFRIQLPKLGKISISKTVTKLIETPKLKLDTPTRFRFQTRTDTPTIKITKLVPGFIPLSIKAKRKKKHDLEETYSADFLGAASESSILGLTSRPDIIYGRERIIRLSALDLKKRKKAGSSINPENIRFKKRRKKVDTDPYKEKKQTGRQLSKGTKRALFGSNKKVKF